MNFDKSCNSTPQALSLMVSMPSLSFSAKLISSLEGVLDM